MFHSIQENVNARAQESVEGLPVQSNEAAVFARCDCSCSWCILHEREFTEVVTTLQNTNLMRLGFTFIPLVNDALAFQNDEEIVAEFTLGNNNIVFLGVKRSQRVSDKKNLVILENVEEWETTEKAAIEHALLIMPLLQKT